jgi:O-antigen/teichoic acid export membrane protein
MPSGNFHPPAVAPPRISLRDPLPQMLSTTSNPQHSVNDDENRHFRTDHLNDDLGGRSMRGGAVTLAVQILKFVVSMAATIVVARLLAPQDYGLVGMVVVLISFLGLFQYLGLPSATVKWQQLNHSQVSTLFWVNVALSTAIMLAVLGSAPLLAWFYNEPRLTGIAAGYAIVIFLTGISIQHIALLTRQMRFSAIAAIDIGALSAGLCVAIFAAWRGAGYWAIVLNQLVFALVTIAGAWTACKWRPGRPVRGSGVRSMLTYGGNLTGHSFTTFFSQNMDNALIGKFWGAYQLGIYSRAYQMLLMPLGQINTPLAAVAVPALSRLADSPERYRAAYLSILEKIAMLTMPGVVFMIVTSDWLMLFLLGPQWREAGRIFMLLGIAAIIQPVSRTGLWLFITQGRSRELFKWGIVGAVLAVVSIVAGLPWGATGVAASYAITDLCITTPLFFWYIGRSGPVRTTDLYRTIAPSACTAICALGVLLLCRPWLGAFQHLLTRLIIAFGITATISLLVLAVIPAGRLAMQNFKEMLLLMLKRKGEIAVPVIPGS